MTAKSFDDAEKVLLKQYRTAIQLSETLEKVSAKYYALWDQVIVGVRDGIPELNISENRSNTMTGASSRRGAIIIASDRWPADGVSWPTGFWAEDMGLNVVAGGAEGSPCIGVWFAERDHKKEVDVDAEESTRFCLEKARALFPSAERDAIRTDEEYNWFGFQLPATYLLDLLINKQDERFVDEMVSKFQTLVMLIPSMNEILLGSTEH